jgi:mercuric ion binding protein
MSLRTILLSSIFLLATFSSKADVLPKKWETITFKVYGNCGMCKTTIESALKDVEGVRFAVWSEKSKKITVKYNPKLISLDKIHAKIAAVGYDTEEAKAKDEVYKNLHGCCQYERPKK